MLSPRIIRNRRKKICCTKLVDGDCLVPCQSQKYDYLQISVDCLRRSGAVVIKKDFINVIKTMAKNLRKSKYLDIRSRPRHFMSMTSISKPSLQLTASGLANIHVSSHLVLKIQPIRPRLNERMFENINWTTTHSLTHSHTRFLPKRYFCFMKMIYVGM